MKVDQQFLLSFLSSVNGIMSESTLCNYHRRIKRFTKFIGERNVTPQLITDWYQSMYKSGVLHGSVLGYHYALKASLTWAIRTKQLDRDFEIPEPPRLPLSLPKRLPFTESEYFQLLAVSAIHFDDSNKGYWTLAIKIAWATGLRLADICLLKWKSIDWQEQTILLIPSKTKRRNKIVEIPLPKELMAALKEQQISLQREPPPDPPDAAEFVMPRMAIKYRKQAHFKLCSEFHELVNIAQIEGGKSMHSFRHSFITRLVERDVNPALIASMTAQNLDMIMRYCKPNIDAKRRALGV